MAGNGRELKGMEGNERVCDDDARGAREDSRAVIGRAPPAHKMLRSDWPAHGSFQRVGGKLIWRDFVAKLRNF